jgi:hypothetical protein
MIGGNNDRNEGAQESAVDVAAGDEITTIHNGGGTFWKLFCSSWLDPLQQLQRKRRKDATITCGLELSFHRMQYL